MRAKRKEIKRIEESIEYLTEKVATLERKDKYRHLIGKQVLGMPASRYQDVTGFLGGQWVPCDPAKGELVAVERRSFLIQVGEGTSGLRRAEHITPVEEVCSET